ncbi:hypothetical protein [Microbacterium luticocti]|uniref:hypothetical protein n=1 Tax=Microbacterium luticocti TaxID=451764 RepID=UPI000405FD05|nr:hypothetical protein [Microbacterium luticocti]
MNTPSEGTSRPPFTSMTPTPQTPSGTPVEVPDARWKAIRDDLAARGVAATPELVSSEQVTWNNGALGCPAPGRSYTQAVVEGMRVVVSVAGTTYDYRFGTTDSPLLCDPSGHPASTP